ncbi:hypothetical protein IPV09_13570 [Tessaracoccus sp. SD287]|uniref:hypothetical protein n=1 Tax=Tessaracoccus sp. SD287 TaxID=2782008 RepID=UPI001A964541|nr:hypothetical protein [Tessaracoccus sp. SD287]MBO1032363.1 hypothetical protein [Tessaracoccus sp. SD287]
MQLRRSRRVRPRGMVTLELAVGLLVAALTLLGASSVIGLLMLQDRAESIAGQAARQAARGDARQLQRVKSLAPSNSSVEVVTTNGWVHATVTVKRSWGPIGPVVLRAQAQQPVEPGA